MKIGRN